MPQSIEERKQKRREYMRNRYATRPEIRRRISEENRARYYANPDESRQKSRAYYNDRKTNPEFKKKVNKLNTVRRFKRLYGITEEERSDILAKQDNKCAICKSDKTKWWHTDHDHKTNRVRGILCHNCNIMIGMSKDNVDVLQAAITYLLR